MLYIFNYIFGKKLLRAYVVLFYYVPNQNKVFLSYLMLHIAAKRNNIFVIGLGGSLKTSS